MFVLVYSFILSKPGQTLQPGHNREGQQAKFRDCPSQKGRLATRSNVRHEVNADMQYLPLALKVINRFSADTHEQAKK